MVNWCNGTFLVEEKPLSAAALTLSEEVLIVTALESKMSVRDKLA